MRRSRRIASLDHRSLSDFFRRMLDGNPDFLMIDFADWGNVGHVKAKLATMLDPHFPQAQIRQSAICDSLRQALWHFVDGHRGVVSWDDRRGTVRIKMRCEGKDVFACFEHRHEALFFARWGDCDARPALHNSLCAQRSRVPTRSDNSKRDQYSDLQEKENLPTSTSQQSSTMPSSPYNTNTQRASSVCSQTISAPSSDFIHSSAQPNSLVRPKPLGKSQQPSNATKRQCFQDERDGELEEGEAIDISPPASPHRAKRLKLDTSLSPSPDQQLMCHDEEMPSASAELVVPTSNWDTYDKSNAQSDEDSDKQELGSNGGDTSSEEGDTDDNHNDPNDDVVSPELRAARHELVAKIQAALKALMQLRPQPVMIDLTGEV